MTTKLLLCTLLATALLSCNSTSNESITEAVSSDIQIAGAMKNVMWKGQLGGIINLDTIQNKAGLYGLGPESFLTGELLINDGKTYVSRVLTDSTMSVVESSNATAPFFVYGNVTNWRTMDLPNNIKDIKALESFIDEQSKNDKRPFAFKLTGRVITAQIHIQNLPKGSTVSSPEEAHQGQVNYDLANKEVEIIGFFSTEHQGIFTHHDSFLHMHLITADKKQMGHLDNVEFGGMTLFLPED